MASALVDPSGYIAEDSIRPAVMSFKQVPIEELREMVLGKNIAFTDFQLFPTVGKGAFGRVRVAKLKNNPDSPPFALKLLKKRQIYDESHVEHVKCEAKIQLMLAHPFIVNLVTVFQDVQRLCFLMEFVSGGELFSRLEVVSRLQPRDARFYACQIVDALQYIHSHEVIYRDLKPENLIIDADGNLKVADFGFAGFLEGRLFTLCGTPEYMAPEIIQSRGHGKPVDWWALGVLIFEMLTGSSPFADESPLGVYQKVMAARIKFPTYFREDLKDLLRGLLHLDCKKRMGARSGEDVQNHRWFEGIVWDDVHNKRIPPPFVPTLQSLDDTSMFDPYAEDDGALWQGLRSDEDIVFKDFTEGAF